MPALTDTYLTIEPFLRHIQALNRHDPDLYRPFYIGGVQVGLIRAVACPLLLPYPGIFKIDKKSVTFLPKGSVAIRSDALGVVVKDLAAHGFFKLRGEPYPVTAGWGEELLATIDRGAYQFFGTSGFGVHVNGLVKREDGLYLWVARRSADRIVAPGKLDNIIGGGLTAGDSVEQTLIKEAQEEAGLSADIAKQAVHVSTLSYAYDTEEGIKRDGLFVYDLYLPETLVPENHDGEVERFDLMPIEAVAALVADTNDFKTNVNLVIIDLLVRHGYLTSDMQGYDELIAGLGR